MGKTSTHYSKGNPKTLTPGPRTPTTDRIRGLTMDRSTDYLYGPPLRTTLKNITKIRNIYFSYGLSHRSCRRKFEQVCKCNRLGFRIGRKLYHSLHIAISFAVAIVCTCMKDREASGKSWNLCSCPSSILFSSFSHRFVNSPGLPSLLSQITDKNKKQAKSQTSQISQIQPPMECTNFPFSATSFSFCQK